MNSLKIKILGLTTAILVLAVGLTVWHNLQTQKAMLTRFADQNGRVLGETVRNSIIANMSSGQNDEVTNTLRNIIREPAIESVRIFDETGRILISARPEETGDLVSAASLLAYRSGKYSLLETVRNQEVHSTIVPIFNAPACLRCHDRSRDVLGILNVHLTLGELEALQRKGREATLLSSCGMMTVLVLALSVFILVYVDTPIRHLVDAMDRVEKGDFAQAYTEIGSSREMALLGLKFNRMVNRLNELIQTTVKNERELAVAQEKLAHHDEIRSMNITLEERLKEIEYLNISLEERIEEVEEANYKVADLASVLEDKNTSLANTVGRLSALYKMGLAVNSTMDLERLFDLLIRKTRETLLAERGYILLIDSENRNLKLAGAVGLSEPVAADTRYPLRPGGVSFWVIQNRQPLRISDIDEASGFNRESPLGFERKTVICAPLIIKGNVIGTITMANKADGNPFQQEDLDLLATIAAQASVAINNARLYEEQQETYLNTVQALVSAVEASDAYTRGHSERVTRYSLVLARHLGLESGFLKTLEQAAILHDIGKIGIDISLLHKVEALSESDIDLLRQHPTIGVRILEPIHFLRDVREIISQHHERFDGEGYPSGLKEDEILLGARILAVADTYDAMTSDRPYRKARSHETALREIGEHAGSQFDPKVAAAFIELCREEGLPT